MQEICFQNVSKIPQGFSKKNNNNNGSDFQKKKRERKMRRDFLFCKKNEIRKS